MLCTRYRIAINFTTAAYLGYTLCESVYRIFGGGVAALQEVFVEASSSGLAIINGDLRIMSVYVAAGTTALKQLTGDCEVFWFKGSNLSNQYACKLEGCAVLRTDDTSDADVVGTVGAIEFSFSGGVHATWPGPGVSYTDNAGSYVLQNL